MSKWEYLQLQEFLTLNPKMRLTQFGDESITIEGEYDLHAQMDNFQPIHESYKLIIFFPKEYPRAVPTVIEIEQRIPRAPMYHTYSGGDFKDGTFCLGSEIKLKSILFETPNILDFFDKILNPFLYSISYKLKYDIYPNGDLDHGEAGLIDDYEHLFQVSGKSSVLMVLHALGKRKRVANKLSCPCGCRKRLGKCKFRFTLEKWRYLDKRRWFRKHLLESFTPIKIVRKKKNKKM